MTFDVFLAETMHFLNPATYAAAATFQAVPAWLRFLESRRLISSDLRRRVADELLPLHATLLRIWQEYRDDPTLAYQGQAWPADAAKEPLQTPPPDSHCQYESSEG